MTPFMQRVEHTHALPAVQAPCSACGKLPSDPDAQEALIAEPRMPSMPFLFPTLAVRGVLARTALVFAAASVLACSQAGSGGSGTPRPSPDQATPSFRVSKTGVFYRDYAGDIKLPALPDEPVATSPVRDSVRQRIKDWKGLYPGMHPRGHVDIEVVPGASCLQVLNAFRGGAIKGDMERVTLRMGDTRVEAPYAGPEDELPSGKRRLFLTFHATGTVDVRPTLCLAPFDTVPAEKLGDTVKELCGVEKECVADVLLSCDAATPFEKVLPALGAIQNLSPRMTLDWTGAVCQPLEGMIVPSGAEGVNEMSLPFVPPPLDPARKYPEGRVSEDITKATGGIDPGAAKTAVHALAETTFSCFMRRPDPNAQAIHDLRLEINRKGQVMQVHNIPSEELIPRNLVRFCLAMTLMKATFPAPQELPAEVTVQLKYTPANTPIQPPGKK
jgi:hypothetical protein